MSDDTPEPITEIVDVTPEELESIKFSKEVEALLEIGHGMIDNKAPEESYDGGLILLIRSKGDGRSGALFHQMTESVSIVELLGAIEIMKRDLLELFNAEQEMMDVEDEAP